MASGQESAFLRMRGNGSSSGRREVRELVAYSALSRLDACTGKARGWRRTLEVGGWRDHVRHCFRAESPSLHNHVLGAE
jgi:hypothetical protein